MKAEGVNLDQYEKAVSAILVYNDAAGVAMNFSQICDFIFYGLADEPLLYRLLTTMTWEGLLNERHGYYSTTDQGSSYLRRSMTS